ncbi:hypothetical protein GCM10027447_31060 [Glycomyces halotolerans]
MKANSTSGVIASSGSSRSHSTDRGSPPVIRDHGLPFVVYDRVTPWSRSSPLAPIGVIVSARSGSGGKNAHTAAGRRAAGA